MLVLDSGQEVTVHSAFLQVRSQALANAVALAAAERQGSSKIRVPLPAVLESAAQLLVRALHSQETQRLLRGLSLSQLLELAHVSHRYAVLELFSMIREVYSPC